jgi:benzylsuccinate CoA-transferase BbsF subunit
VARDLAAWADVLLESFMPGQVARFGLAYEELRKVNPALIMLSTALMGQTGPQALMAGYGNLGAAVSGFQMLVGNAGELPIGPFGPYTDYVGPRFALVVLLAALDHRARTGEGAYIDVSQAEAGIEFLAPQIADYCATGRIACSQGNRDPQFAPHGVFRSRGADTWVAIVARHDAEWTRLAAIIGGPALAAGPRFATLERRKANEDELEQLVADWAGARDGYAIEAELQSQGIPAHIVMASEDFVRDPQLIARGHIVRLPHPLMGETVFEAARYRLADTPATYERSAPTFGRDNSYVLREILGYPAEKVAALEAAGILK